MNKMNSKLQEKYYQRVSKIDNELDQVAFSLKSKVKDEPLLGNILYEPVNSGELQTENFNELESGESSGPSSRLGDSDRVLYVKLQKIRKQLHKYKHTQLAEETENSLGEGFLGTLPASIQSAPGGDPVQLQSLLNALKSRESSLCQEQTVGKQESIDFSSSLGSLAFSEIAQSKGTQNKGFLEELSNYSNQKDNSFSSINKVGSVDWDESGFVTFKGRDKDETPEISGAPQSKQGNLSSSRDFFGEEMFGTERNSNDNNEDSEGIAQEIFPPIIEKRCTGLVPVHPPSDPPKEGFAMKGRSLQPIGLPLKVLSIRLHRLRKC